MKFLRKISKIAEYESFPAIVSLVFIAIGISFLYSVATSAQMLEDLNLTNGTNTTPLNITTIKNGTFEANASKLNVIVPLYTYPNQEWDRLAAAQTANPNVQIYAILNANNGPGAYNVDYASGASKLEAAGVKTMGYVWTKYGSRPAAEVQTDIDLWMSYYQVDGIFLDEMAYPGCGCVGTPQHYMSLSNYAKFKGAQITVGNPGAMTHMGEYASSVDVIGVYENQGLPSSAVLSQFTYTHTRDKWMILPYNVPSITQENLKDLSSHAGFIYITSEFMPDGSTLNPWTKLPPYFENMLTYMAA